MMVFFNGFNFWAENSPFHVAIEFHELKITFLNYIMLMGATNISLKLYDDSKNGISIIDTDISQMFAYLL